MICFTSFMPMDLPKILHVPTLFWYIIQIRDILLTSVYSYLNEALKSLIDKISALQSFFDRWISL